MPRWTAVTFRAFLTNCDQRTHTSSEISTILLKGSNVQTFVSIEETVLREFFNSLDPKFFQHAALNHCCRCSLEYRDLQRVFTGAKMLCYRRIHLVLHCKAEAVYTFPEGATSLPHIDCVALGMATGDDVNHRCVPKLHFQFPFLLSLPLPFPLPSTFRLRLKHTLCIYPISHCDSYSNLNI